MLTLMVFLFIAFSIICGVFGLVFKITFQLFKWIFLGVLAIVGMVFIFAFAVPVLIILPFAAVIYFIFYAIAYV